MKMYMILMRGNQANFEKLSAEERRSMIQAHSDFAKRLAAKGIIVEADGFEPKSLMLNRELQTEEVNVSNSPYIGTKEQLSGFYLIKAETDEEALEIAKECPSLQQGESVELVTLGH